MPAFVSGPVGVSVPATSANLGPGFDALGLALDLRDEVTASVTPSGLRIDVEGVAAGEVPRDESHLVYAAMVAAFTEMGCDVPGIDLRCRNTIPHARGLGSSSAAIVAGICAARGLVATGSKLLDDDAVFSLAARIEGHPDNVSPALLGGFTISGSSGEPWTTRVGVDPRISVVVFVPPHGLATSVARGLLPERVPHADAVANAGHAALLVAALSGRPELLLAATVDHLHQDYRQPAMPETLQLVHQLRADGVPAVVSGAGPTVLAFVDSSGPVDLPSRCPRGWVSQALAVDRRGAVVTAPR